MNEYMKKIDLDTVTVEGHKKRAAKAFNDFIDLLIEEGYELKSEYVKNSIKVTLKPPCGHDEYEVEPKSFKKGCRCPECAIKKTNKGLEKHKEEISQKVRKEFIELVKKEGYEMLGEYVNSHTKITLKPPCGHDEYEVKPNNFKNGNRCPECAREKKRTFQKERSSKFKLEFVEILEKEGYEMLSEYKGVDKKVSLKCNKGHIYSVKPSDFKKGSRCPECNTSSHGEELTKKILEQYNIVFEREKKFDGLTGLGGRNLRFDFYIPEHNVIIEINGEGHYKEYTNNFLNDNTIIHDKIKREFCKQQGIKLYDIEYLSTVIGRNNALKHVEERALEIIKEIKGEI